MAILKVDNIEKNDVEKQSWERFSITIDFSDEMGSGALVNSYSALVYDGSGVSVGTTILAGLSESGGILTVGLKGGVDGTVYTVTSKVTSDQAMPDGEATRFEADIKLTVKDVVFY